VPTPRYRLFLPLSLIVLLAFVLRVWNIGFGLPYIYPPDEPRYVNVALQIFQTGSTLFRNCQSMPLSIL
jgi:4-amino-4-deoxy-L-arabinose transferase-like glycosyltransferase